MDDLIWINIETRTHITYIESSIDYTIHVEFWSIFFENEMDSSKSSMMIWTRHWRSALLLLFDCSQLVKLSRINVDYYQNENHRYVCVYVYVCVCECTCNLLYLVQLNLYFFFFFFLLIDRCTHVQNMIEIMHVYRQRHTNAKTTMDKWVDKIYWNQKVYTIWNGIQYTHSISASLIIINKAARTHTHKLWLCDVTRKSNK